MDSASVRPTERGGIPWHREDLELTRARRDVQGEGSRTRGVSVGVSRTPIPQHRYRYVLYRAPDAGLLQITEVG